MTCSICSRPIRPGEIVAQTGFGVACQICTEKGEACAPTDDDQ